MATLARTSAGFCIEIPAEAARGDKTFVLPPATSHLIQNPNVGTNPNLLVELGKRLLETAKTGDVVHVKELLGRGAPMTADWLGTSPLHHAAFFGHYKTAELLLQSGCSRDARTKVEKTALHLAACAGNSDIVELLLKANSEVNCADMLKMTPLHWAVESGDCKSVELLLRHGADIYVENKFDKSPLEIASDKGNTDIYEMLLNAESYRMHANNTAESELATRTISTEMNAHQQYDLTETITVPPAAHQELVPTSDSIKLLSNYGIRMLPEDDSGDASVAMSGGTVSLTEAGKRILNDTSNPSVIKKLVATPKLQTVQIKQEGSATPKIIRINGSTANIKSENSNSSVIQPATRVIRLSTSQLQNIKLAAGLKGQKVVLANSKAGTAMSTTTSPSVTTSASSNSSSTIRIVKVGNQPKKTIAIMPAASTASSTANNSTTPLTTSLINLAGNSNLDSNNSTDNSRMELKRKIAEKEDEAKRILEEYEQKLAEAKRLREELEKKSVVDEMDET